MTSQQTVPALRLKDISAKKTKIVATIGPATESEEMMTRLVAAGMNVVRLNFSHGSHEEHYHRLVNARSISKRLKAPIAVLQDLSGPKIRIGELKEDEIELKEGDNFILTSEECLGDTSRVSVNYSLLPKEVKAGGTIFLRDGRIRLEIKRVVKNDIHCKVVVGGKLKSKKGVNVPGAYLSIDCLTEKDRKDLLFGIKHDVDFMAISFVRKGSDVKKLKDILAKSKADIRVIAKIETEEAIENIDEIIAESDGIMVARGDLATEVPAEQVPTLQKMIVRKCNESGKPVIVATQMLESMINSSIPTRAEINDIANAILDGADAVMLSEETTLGQHPEEAVKVMSKVAVHTEKTFPYVEVLKREHLKSKDITGAISYSAVNSAHELDAKAIIALTVSGFTSRMIARHRPQRPILVMTPDKKTYNRTALKFNCYPILIPVMDRIANTIDLAKKLAVENNFASKNDIVVIVAGIPFSQQGNTNLLTVQRI